MQCNTQCSSVRVLAALFVVGSSVMCRLAWADLEVVPERSLEWLIDASDVVVIATVLGDGSNEELRLEETLKLNTGRNEVSLPKQLGKLEWQKYAPSHKLEPHREPGDRLMLFGRRDAESRLRIHHLVYLRAAAVTPPPSGSYQEACRRIYLRANAALYGYPNRAHCERVCAVVNMHGEILVDPDYVIASVRQRVASGPTVPADAEVAKLEHFYSLEARDAYGGFYAGSMPLHDYEPWVDMPGGSECTLILVPPEPQFLSAAFSALKDRYENIVYAKPALRRLENYPHDSHVLSWLKSYLREGQPEKVETRTIDGKEQSELLRREVQKTIDTLIARGASLPPSSH